MKLNRGIYIIVALLIVASCKPSRESQIIGLWQEVGIKNPQIDDAIEQQHHFMDSVGSSTDSLTNITLYGTTNIDTFKKSIRSSIDSFGRSQAKEINETWFDFHPNGLVYLHSSEGLDSAKWSFEDDGALMLDEQALKDGGAKIRMEVQALNDSALQLHFTEKYLSSTASFRRVKR